MKKLTSMKLVTFLLPALGFAAMAARPAAAQNGSRVDVGVDYNYVRTNAPPGDCGCFAMNGGSAWVAFNFSHSFGIVGEIASQRASNISSSGADLTLTSYLAGPRYTWGRPPLCALRSGIARRSLCQWKPGSGQFWAARISQLFWHDRGRRIGYRPHPAHRGASV